MKRTIVPLAILVLVLTGCTNSAEDGTSASTSAGSPSAEPVEETQAPPAEPLDLTGTWKMTNSQSPDSYQEATITGDTIVINWVNEAESMTALYWAGTYVPPIDDAAVYTWDSANDTTQTDASIMASSDATKIFTYDNGTLEYELTALGVTMTVEMARQ